ncbi:MAG: ribosome recycling factor [Selenomonadales bacterium]|jgi:ribosome recycling factor|nr:ribosome recycling factor [Selenomonadales bacterium]
MIKDVLKEVEDKMKKSVQSLQKELGGLRAGRATPALLEKLVVEYYGVPSPIHQVASVNVPDARTLVIQPWDKAMLKPIEKAIQKSDLGLTPNSDGTLIRLVIPPLTTERRNELVKVARKKAEEAKVAVRNLRRDANELVKKLEKDGDISEDQAKKGQEEVQKLTDRYVKETDEVLLAKEAEITEV